LQGLIRAIRLWYESSGRFQSWALLRLKNPVEKPESADG
jgi:hypothetical protein